MLLKKYLDSDIILNHNNHKYLWQNYIWRDKSFHFVASCNADSSFSRFMKAKVFGTTFLMSSRRTHNKS